MSTVITNAPEAYDYEWTVLSSTPMRVHFSAKMFGSVMPKEQKPFRRVELDDRENGYYVEYQCNRYRSGGYLVMTPEQYDTHLREGYLEADESI